MFSLLQNDVEALDKPTTTSYYYVISVALCTSLNACVCKLYKETKKHCNCYCIKHCVWGGGDYNKEC